MPREFRWSAPVWQADVDAFGELRTSTLLKFLQEVATRASTDAGFDPAYYAASGTMWLVRRTTLTLLGSVGYGDELEARTWIADFRRVRSQRRYEVRAGGRVVATAITDWVYVDRAQSRPRTIPMEMQQTFVPEGAPPAVRTPMALGDAGPGVTTLSHRVAPHELDALAHVNNAHYVHYLEQAALDAATAAGWPLHRQIAAGGRLRPQSHDIEYLDGALLDDVLTVTTWPLDDTHRIERATLVTRAATGEALLRAVSGYVWTDHEGGSHPLPPDVRASVGAPRS